VAFLGEIYDKIINISPWGLASYEDWSLMRGRWTKFLLEKKI
jgi:hypothetical protein